MSTINPQNPPTTSTTRVVKKTSTALRVYTHVRECERELIRYMREFRAVESLSMSDMEIMIRLQTAEEEAQNLVKARVQGVNDIVNVIGDAFKTWCLGRMGSTLLKKVCTEENKKFVFDTLINVIETIPIVVTLISNAPDWIGVTVALYAGVKMIVGGSVLLRANDLMQNCIAWMKKDPTAKVQSGSEDERSLLADVLTSARQWIEGGEAFTQSPCFKRFSNLLKYFLSFGIFSTFGLDFSLFPSREFQESAVKKTHSNKVEFIATLFRDLIWTMERCMQAVKLGTFSVFYHSSDSYVEWSNRAFLVIEDEMKLSNSHITGIDPSNFMFRLDTLLSEGAEMLKYAIAKEDKSAINVMLSRLRLVRVRQVISKAAQEQRRTPDSLLVFGNSSVGKSLFLQVLYHYYAQLKGKEVIGSNCMYTRIATDKHWNSFRSYMWAIILDDIGMFSPKLGTVDETLKDVIQIVNAVPFTPPQASLEDKGMHPMRAELVLATTNVEHLNASAYFTCPLAVQRRFRHIVEISVKEKYRLMNSDGKLTNMVDPSKTPVELPSGEFPDIWEITLKQVFGQPSATGGPIDEPAIKVIKHFTDVHEFLGFWGSIIHTRDLTNSKVDHITQAMQATKVCKTCFQVRGCECKQVQAGEIDDDIGGEEDELFHDAVSTEVEVRLSASARRKESIEKKLAVFKTLYDEEVAVRLVDEEAQEDFLREESPTEWIEMQLQQMRYGDWVRMDELVYTNTLMREMNADRREFIELLDKYGLQHVSAVFDEQGWNRDFWQGIRNIVWLENGVVKMKTEFCRMVEDHILVRCRNTRNWIQRQAQKVVNAFNDTEHLVLAMAHSLSHNIKREFDTQVEELSDSAAERIILFCQDTCSKVMHGIGERIATRLNDPKVWAFVVILASAYPAYKLISRIFWPTIQGSEMSIPKDNLVNVWSKSSEFRLEKQDVGVSTPNTKSLSFEEVSDRIGRNVVFIEVTNSEGLKKFGRALCLVGHVYVTNNHTIADDVTQMLVIDSNSGSNNLKSSMCYGIDPRSIIRKPDLDLCFFTCFLPDKKSIMNYLPSESMSGGAYDGVLLGRLRTGVATARKTIRVVFEHGKPIPAPVDANIDSWMYQLEDGMPTQYGDCGSILLIRTGRGFVVGGMHQTYHEYTGASAIALKRETLDGALAEFDEHLKLVGSDPCVQGAEMHDLHWKSVFHKIPGNMKVFGSFAKADSFRAAPKSRVVETVTCEAAQDEGFILQHTKPTMTGSIPWEIAATPCAAITGNMDHAVIEQCAVTFANELIAGVKETEFACQMHPLTDIQAVNGIPGVRFMDGINRGSSIGPPRGGSKRRFLRELTHDEDPKEEYPEGVMYVDEIMREVAMIESEYARGERHGVVFKEQLKDEGVTFKKAKMGKTRVFSIAPASWSHVVRKNLLPFIRVMQSNPLLFEAAIGINPTSAQWAELRDYLTHFGLTTNVAGDYGNYDKRMYGYLIIQAFRIITDILKACGCSDEQIRSVHCIGADTAYAYHDYQGDLVQFFGSNPSGHPLTVIINSLVNALYMRYCYVKLNPKSECVTFKENVHLITYGDDNEMNVSLNCSWFNHTAIQRVLASIEVVYTMADKDAPSEPFIHFSEVSFLKRKWVFEPEAEIWLAPLEWASLAKALTIGTLSDAVCPQEQAAQTVRNVALEMFHHGRADFDENIAKLRRIISKSGITTWVAPDAIKTWDEYIELHARCSTGLARSPAHVAQTQEST